MNVLILGGTGFIGPVVVRRLASAGHAVTIFNRGRKSVDLPASVRRIVGERAELQDFRGELSGLEPDVVLDMYAMTERDARQTVGAVRGIAPRLVVISSLDTYRAFGRLIGIEPGDPVELPLTEESPLRERLYPFRGDTRRPPGAPDAWQDDYDKILVERAVMEASDLEGTALRLPMVYGPGDEQHRFRPYVKRMDEGQKGIPLSEGKAGWRSSWGYVENVAAAIALAVTSERATGKIYNVAEAEHPTLAEIVEELASYVGWSGEVVPVPDEALPTPLNTAQDLITDSSKIRDELGFVEPVPRDQAMRKTIAWEREGPPPIGEVAFDYDTENALIQRYG